MYRQTLSDSSFSHILQEVWINSYHTGNITTLYNLLGVYDNIFSNKKKAKLRDEITMFTRQVVATLTIDEISDCLKSRFGESPILFKINW